MQPFYSCPVNAALITENPSRHIDRMFKKYAPFLPFWTQRIAENSRLGDAVRSPKCPSRVSSTFTWHAKIQVDGAKVINRHQLSGPPILDHAFIAWGSRQIIDFRSSQTFYQRQFIDFRSSQLSRCRANNIFQWFKDFNVQYNAYCTISFILLVTLLNRRS